eukprot:229638_1
MHRKLEFSNKSNTMSLFTFQLKYLCAAATILTILSLFISHQNNPWMLSDISIPSTNYIYSRLKSTQSTSEECKQANTNKYPDIYRSLSDQPSSKYAYIHCIDLTIDLTEQMYGILAFEGGLRRTKSKYDHILLIPQSKREDLNTINSLENVNSLIGTLTDSIKHPKFKVIPFPSTEIDEAFLSNPNHKQFRDTFHHAYAFKKIFQFTNYEKLVLLKYNMVILSNSMDIIFNYPTPSAPPERWSGLESNIACFLYSLKSQHTDTIYDKILKHLKDDIYVWYNDEENKNRDINDNKIKWDKDSYNTEKGTFQSLINAIYWKREYGFGGINQIHQKFAINTNKLSNKRTKYFIEHRPNMLYLIEFVDDYPPTRKARDRCIVRSRKMIQNDKLDWFEIAMNAYFVQFWLDLNIICSDERNKNICMKLNFKFEKELEASIAYNQTLGYPFPYVEQK